MRVVVIWNVRFSKEQNVGVSGTSLGLRRSISFDATSIPRHRPGARYARIAATNGITKWRHEISRYRHTMRKIRPPDAISTMTTARRKLQRGECLLAKLPRDYCEYRGLSTLMYSRSLLACVYPSSKMVVPRSYVAT
jgi:hypothetical protein